MPEVTNITKSIEFDAGHRVPSHDSKCRNAHGHRYKVEATITGPILPVRGQSDDGMVVDFGILKTLLMTHVHDVYDHGFIVFLDDVRMTKALRILGDAHRTIVVPFVPTAENLAHDIYVVLDREVRAAFPAGVVLTAVRVFETPTSVAEHRRQ